MGQSSLMSVSLSRSMPAARRRHPSLKRRASGKRSAAHGSTSTSTARAIRDLKPPVSEGWQYFADRFEADAVEPGVDDRFLLARFGEEAAPRIEDQRMAVAF